MESKIWLVEMILDKSIDKYLGKAAIINELIFVKLSYSFKQQVGVTKFYNASLL